MVGDRTVAAPAIASLMDCYALAAEEYLDRSLRRADVDLLTDEAVRHGIKEAVELGMIVRRHAGKPPFGEFVVLAGQARECGLLDSFEKMAAADAKAPHDMIVDAIESAGDCGVRLGKREKGLPPQPAEDTGLGETDSVLDLRLVLRTSRPGRQHADATMGRHHGVAAVDLRIVEGSAVDAGLQIIGHDQAGRRRRSGTCAHARRSSPATSASRSLAHR
ncbi:hypothetical protein Mame_01336 [Martelella mediterranea DSM 17316]|uniref:Uncharacterized protein n=1 Tax=Martelella mediterranea DSM 17316 TaxID=1122214 RepID=A0A1U9YZ34_9HYPH|nr:hypothetical protein Mame_01336 [Martelella mediterranea DSM 17316]